MRIPESDEVCHEAWWRKGADFSWCWPRFNVYRPADKHVRILLNRYPHNIIGVAAVIFGRCWGVRWKWSKSSRTRKDRLRGSS